jgi:hypothetical protein
MALTELQFFMLMMIATQANTHHVGFDNSSASARRSAP